MTASTDPDAAERDLIDLGEVAIAAGLSSLLFAVAPWIAPLVGLAAKVAHLLEGGGVLATVSRVLGVGKEMTEAYRSIGNGEYLEQVHRLYEVCLYVGVLGLATVIVVGALSAVSRVVGRAGVVLEVLAVGLWGLPVVFWCLQLLSAVLVVIGVAAVHAYQAFKVESWPLALLDVFVSLGILVVFVPAVCLLFVAAWGASLVFWRYAVSIGLAFGRPGGVARRVFRYAHE
jgi:hypothetical protein